jgi:DNA repair protein RadD
MTSLHHHTLPGLATKSPAISARPYQTEAVQSVIDYWCEGGGNPLVSMATGTGKSVVIAQLVKELESLNPGIRIVMLVHSRELVAQNAAALLRHHPTAHIGINSAGLNRRDTRQPILFASIQSVFRHNADSIGRRDVIMIDEAHLTPRKGDGMYRTFLATMKAANPDMRVVGFTATPFRLDSGRLDKGADRLFDDLIYDYGIGRGIEDGYLSPLISKATARTLDVSGVAKRGGEFVEGALQAAIDKDWITQEAVSEIVAMGEDRRSWLVFCAGVDHAIHVRDAIRARGVSCETVTGETPIGERDRMLRDFKAGKLRCLTNVSVLTTGFDAPATDLVAMLRPTLSAGLYIQMVGRGTRLAPAKENALILDFAGNVRRHGPVDVVSVTGGPGGTEGAAKEGDVRAKECPTCATLVALNTRTCPVCSHEWPPLADKPKHEARADASVAILSTEPPAWVPVEDVRYFRHEKAGSHPTLRVEYGSGMSVYRQWLCFEHDPGFALNKAHQWWRQMAGTAPPATVDEALERASEITPPDEIRVKPNGKYFEIVGLRHRRAA